MKLPPLIHIIVGDAPQTICGIAVPPGTMPHEAKSVLVPKSTGSKATCRACLSMRIRELDAARDKSITQLCAADISARIPVRPRSGGTRRAGPTFKAKG
jgi:hypothetical protein